MKHLKSTATVCVVVLLKLTTKDEVVKVLTQVITELEGLPEDREEVADYTKKMTRGSKED